MLARVLCVVAALALVACGEEEQQPAAPSQPLPAIVVDTPEPGDTVTSPLKVAGTSNVFEATSQIELIDRDSGERLVRDFVTATSGSGTRGTWETTLRFDVPAGTELELYTYESSAEDGSPLHEVRVPLVAG